MAYNLQNRFPEDPKYYPFYDPGTYQPTESNKIKPAKIQFLSSKPRITQPGNKIWTHTIYNADIPPKIPNCTAMMSKIPRFPYEAFTQEELDEIVCRCGVQTCECPVADEDQEKQIVCQGKIPKRIFKGLPRRLGSSGLSAPSKGDHGFNMLPDGTNIRLKDVVTDESPPFYDARVKEATAFYHGCKWSKWSGSRDVKFLEKSPGPADYTIEHPPTDHEICAEKVRALKRKTSKQYRFIEMVQRRNILESAPCPATYYPEYAKGTDLKYLGPNAERFPSSSKYDVHPGPAEHCLRRDFDPPYPPEKRCHAILPQRACFGVKDKRFKPRKDVGPSPVTYCPNYKPCKFLTCPSAPFGSATIRFKSDPVEYSDDEVMIASNEKSQKEMSDHKQSCPSPTWEFKSKTVRMEPLAKKWHDPSPADYCPSLSKLKRQPQLQYQSPFFSSEGRFRPWFNWSPVYGKDATPGPGYYCLEKPRCLSAVNRGPLSRSPRFLSPYVQTPAPNEYKVGGGLETVLATHNQRLKSNINFQHSFHWKPTTKERKLTLEEREAILINKCISICTTPDEMTSDLQVPGENASAPRSEKKKLLRYFLYKHQIPICS